MNKTNNKIIDTRITITIISTIIILIIGALILFSFVVYSSVDLWILTSIYLFMATVPFIIFSLSFLNSLNIDSISSSTTTIIIVHNKDIHVHKTKSDKCTKHLIIGV